MNRKEKGEINKNLSYRDAGVDIDRGSRLVDRIKPYAAATQRPGVLSGLGGFGALFEIPIHRYRQPVLVSGTDGVGTKLMLANSLNHHSTIGIDLVAMCVNDLLVSGAEPLFFLDYYATGHLDENTACHVIKGISDGCKLAGVALTGGETAEMPGMYQTGDYDLAGFCVGIVEKDDIIDGRKVNVGDALIALASSGPHANGYSLIRKIIEVNQTNLSDPFNGATLGEILLKPTRIYVQSILALQRKINIHAMAHITGGGLSENLPRVLPQDQHARINCHSWRWPNIFNWLAESGNVTPQEMFRTFNCGVGMVICVAQHDLNAALEQLRNLDETAWHLGNIAAGDNNGTRVEFINL